MKKLFIQLSVCFVFASLLIVGCEEAKIDTAAISKKVEEAVALKQTEITTQAGKFCTDRLATVDATAQAKIAALKASKDASKTEPASKDAGKADPAKGKK